VFVSHQISVLDFVEAYSAIPASLSLLLVIGDGDQDYRPTT
jgi:hypothetical protein